MPLSWKHSLQIGLYLGLKELHVSRCVWRALILDCDVDMRLCVVKLAKKKVSVNHFYILWPYNTPRRPRKKHYKHSISTDNICN